MHLLINRSHLLSLLVLFLNPMRSLLLSSSSETKLFELHSLPPGYLTFSGDSYLQSDASGANAIALTKEDMPSDAPKSAGMVVYNRPISFLDPMKKVPSFSTMFAFSIKYEEESGDGLAFLILPDDHPHESHGYLGLVDSTDLTRNKFIAIEFDTKFDPIFQDPDDNHLGLDINSLTSVQLATSFSLGIDLKSGNLIRTWIDYKSDEKRLEVFLSDSQLKPVRPLLKVAINLSDYLRENMFVGFSAATQGSMQSTRIEQWEFTILEFGPPSPPPFAEPRTFPKPSESRHRHSHLRRVAIRFIVGVCSVSFVVLFGWFFWKKLMGVIQRLEGTNNITNRSSGGTSEIRLSIPDPNPDEVVRGLMIEKVFVFDNETELICVKTVATSSIPPLHQFANTKA